MTLLEAQKQRSYRVKFIDEQENVQRRLAALGILEGTHIEIMNRKSNGSTIIRVRGTRWAIGNDIAVGIQVEEKDGQ